MRTYVGRREASTIPGNEHAGPDPQLIMVNADGSEEPLNEVTEPEDYPFTLTGGLEWGYEGSGPINLAGAILNDALGFVPSGSVVLDFMESVIAELPRLGFELTAETLQVWIDARLADGSANARRTTGSLPS